MHRHAGHLHEIAERGFSGIVLPVGVGSKADGGIERQVWRRRSRAGGGVGGAESHRIKWEHALEPLQQIKDKKAEDAEGEQASGVLRPALVGVFFDATKGVAD